MLSWIQGAAMLRHRTSDIRQIVYVTGALLEKAMIVGGLTQNCDSVVKNREYLIRQIPLHWTDVDVDVHVGGLRHWL